MGESSKSIRIGNAQAFWGDRADAAAEMLFQEPELDYLTLDYLAEVSMSILAMQRERDPEAGFARDFVEVIRSLVPYWASGGRCRVIANAGGLNPRGCAEACKKALEEGGCRPLKIGVVSGDDVLESLRSATGDPAGKTFRNLDTGAAIGDVRDRLVTANAYVGAAPIVKALADGADIVITGRVADPSLVVAPCIHHFGWKDDDWNHLAGATVAGHLIECGTQVTGGISTDWLEVPDPGHIGFPIVEVADDGSCVVTKPRGSGGRVTAMTVKEQLVYEIGDPGNYLSPDVAVSFHSLELDDLGGDRVRVSGAMGKPRPDTYKVSATFRDGYRAAGTLTVIGRSASDKAYRISRLVYARVEEAGGKFSGTSTEWLGSNDCHKAIVRMAVEAESRDTVERFSRELMPFITAGPPGTTGYAEGRPRVHPLFRYWPCVVDRNDVTPHIEFVDSADCRGLKPQSPWPPTESAPARSGPPWSDATVEPWQAPRAEEPRQLYDIACARSGDKGINANVGIIARTEEAWPLLQSWLTAERVQRYVPASFNKSVDRYELPNLRAINFVLHGVLKNGLMTDAQGKGLGQMLLEMQLPADAVRSITAARRG